MAFVRNQRRGDVWKDVQLVDSIIEKNISTFTLSAKKERDIESAFTVALQSNQDRFNGKVISKIQSDNSVEGITLFGKKNYPDMSLDRDGVAIDLTRIDEDKSRFSQAIGSSFIYRQQYKFVFQIFILTENAKDVWEEATNDNGNLMDICKELSDNEIFIYIIPGFKVKTGSPQIFKVLE